MPLERRDARTYAGLQGLEDPRAAKISNLEQYKFI